MFEQDYLIRMIKGIAQMLAKILFGKQSPGIELPKDNHYTSQQQLYNDLIRLTDTGHINEAENRLYDLDITDKKNYEVVLAFYHYLNDYSDDYLESCRYSRKEIESGLADMSHRFDISIYDNIKNLFS